MINLKYTKNVLSSSESESLKQYLVFFVYFFSSQSRGGRSPGRLYG